jgi:hypothetical protein
MTANITPTIITSKLFLGAVPSTQLGNVAWNDDGQCLFLTKRGVTVMVRFVHVLPPIRLPLALLLVAAFNSY